MVIGYFTQVELKVKNKKQNFTIVNFCFSFFLRDVLVLRLLHIYVRDNGINEVPGDYFDDVSFYCHRAPVL